MSAASHRLVLRHAGVAVALLLALTVLVVARGATASSSQATAGAATASATGDCDHDGTLDVSEPAWAGRDDDEDGVCNGSDNCPLEANPGQDPSVCAMQAITVPADPNDLAAPHVTYSGATTTLKGIARYGGNQYMWDFGDGAPPTAWLGIANPYNLGIQHAYQGAAGTRFTATLSIRNSSVPSTIATATYPVEIRASTTSSSNAEPAQFDVRAAMAADQALWFLHLSATRDRYSDGAPGRSQGYEYWPTKSGTCLAADAFELHGSTLDRSWQSDPYVEDVRRALTFVLAGSFAVPISVQALGNPDANGNGLGISPASNSEPEDAACALALADGGGSSLITPAGGSGVYGRTYASVVQDAVDWLAFAQDESPSAAGGWDFTANQQSSDTGVPQSFAELALRAAAGSGATVPSFVSNALGTFSNTHRYSGLNFSNGGWGWFNGFDPAWLSTATTGAGLLAEKLVGTAPSNGRVQAGLGFLYRNWNDIGSNICWTANLGQTRSMYAVARSLGAYGLSRIVDYNYQTGAQTTSSFDWYYTPPGQSQQGIGTNLVSRQRADGSWTDTTGCSFFDQIGVTAMDASILLLGNPSTPAPVNHPPVASAGGPYAAQPGASMPLSALGSSDPDGDSLTYSWDITGSTTGSSSTSSNPFFHVGNVAAGTVYPVCVTVTDPGGLSSTSCSTVTVVAPERPPVCTILSPNVVASNRGTLQDVALDGSRSSDPDGTPLTFSWSTTGPGTFDNPTAALARHSFGPLVGAQVSWTDTLSVSDGSLTSSCSATVTVNDDLPPRFVTTPNNLTVASDANTATAVANWLASVTAVDVGMNAPAAISDDFVLPSGGLQPGTTTTVTWTAQSVTNVLAQVSATLTIVGDSTPPIVTPEATGTLGLNGWYTGDAHLAWSVADPDSAVTSTAGCDPSDVKADTPAAGTTFTCTARSAGGTTVQSFTVKRDGTPPSISVTKTPAPNAAGWNRSDVTATFTCVDAGSDLAVGGCPAAIVFTQGSAPRDVTATDSAGNTASRTVDGGLIDETAPTLSGAPTAVPNLAGWYSGDVVVHWVCADEGGSGLAASCPADDHVASEGRNVVATQTVTDVAGNSTTASTAPLKIDRTAPETAAVAPTGWTNAGVTVALTATDALSGVQSTYWKLDGGPQTQGSTIAIDADGTHTLAFWSVDVAGNVEPEQTKTVLIDRSAPTIGHTLSPLPNSAGWNTTDVTVAFTCADPVSGIAACTLAQLVSGEGADLKVTGHARDNAGNTADDVVHVAIDRTPPVIGATADRAPNGNGWYAADVTVHFDCTDALSGVASCSPAVTLGEGHAQTATGTGKDIAGNTASARLTSIDIDETPPTVLYTGNLGVYDLNATVSITCSATDSLSGVASSTCANISGPAYAFGLGTYTASAVAVDRAGNSGTGSVSFTVQVTCSSLSSLVRSFVSNASVAGSLVEKIDSICSAPNQNAKAGKLGAFDNALSAQTGKAISAADAATLKRLAANL